MIKNGGFRNATLEGGLGISTNDGSIALTNRKMLAELKKQYGYGNATMSDLGASTDNGVIDWQIEGFERDMFYKLANIISQENQMLVQNDKSIYPWQVDVLTMAYEKMSGGKVDIEITGYGESRTISATWRGDATDSDGV